MLFRQGVIRLVIALIVIDVVIAVLIYAALRKFKPFSDCKDVEGYEIGGKLPAWVPSILWPCCLLALIPVCIFWRSIFNDRND